MFTVSDLYNMNTLKSVKILTGESGFSRKIQNVGVLDHEYISGNIKEEFLPNDLVLSSFLSLRERPDLTSDAIKALIDIGVSCVGIKKIYKIMIPMELIQYAKERDFSIFIFEETISFERIIISVFDNLKYQDEEELEEEKINQLWERRESPGEVRKLSLNINPGFYDTGVVIYLRNTHCFLMEKLELIRAEVRKKEKEGRICWSLCSYKSGMLIILTCKGGKIDCLKLSETIGLYCLTELKDTKIGVSTVVNDLGDLGIAMMEAIYACEFSRPSQKSISYFRDIGPGRFLLPMAESYWGKRYCSQVLQNILQCPRCDRKKNEALFHTLKIFVDCGRNIKKTAEISGHHENTVRYRIHRVYELLDMKIENELDWLELSTAVYLYERIHKDLK